MCSGFLAEVGDDLRSLRWYIDRLHDNFDDGERKITLVFGAKSKDNKIVTDAE